MHIHEHTHNTQFSVWANVLFDVAGVGLRTTVSNYRVCVCVFWLLRVVIKAIGTAELQPVLRRTHTNTHTHKTINTAYDVRVAPPTAGTKLGVFSAFVVLEGLCVFFPCPATYVLLCVIVYARNLEHEKKHADTSSTIQCGTKFDSRPDTHARDRVYYLYTKWLFLVFFSESSAHVSVCVLFEGPSSSLLCYDMFIANLRRKPTAATVCIIRPAFYCRERVPHSRPDCRYSNSTFDYTAAAEVQQI